MKHSATIHTDLTRAEGKNIIVFITYSDKVEQELILDSALSDKEILLEAENTARRRVEELNHTEEMAEKIRNHITITI